MSAGGALQSAIAAALSDIGDLSGVFDGPPARAAYPYAALDATTETDWSHKSGEGREVLVAITVWDDEPVRLHGLADQVERQLQHLLGSRRLAAGDDAAGAAARAPRRRGPMGRGDRFPGADAGAEALTPTSGSISLRNEGEFEENYGGGARQRISAQDRRRVG